MNQETVKMIADSVSKAIFEKYGFNAGLPGRTLRKEIEFSESRGRFFFDMAFEPGWFGIFAMGIEECHLSVYFERLWGDDPDPIFWVKVGLNYTLKSGGRNGCDILTLWIEENGEIIDEKWEGE